MIMHSLYSKEREGIVENSPVGHLSSASAPWWSGLGTRLPYGESVGQLKSSSVVGHSNQFTAMKFAENATKQGFEKGVTSQFTIFPGNFTSCACFMHFVEISGSCFYGHSNQFTAMKFAENATKQGFEKGVTSQFTIFPGDCKKPVNGQPPVYSKQPSRADYQGRFELGLVQPVVCVNYPYGDQCYGVLSTYGPQVTGRVMLPLNLTTDDGPIFVNAKQYHGILRRRKCRAKAELKNKLAKNRKPYLHLSRHLHAMRRPRGCGGRFLNTKKSDECKKGANTKKNGEGNFYQSTEAPNSEVLQSNVSNLTSPREANCGMSFLSGHGIVMPSKWVAAADSCCNLKF